MQANSSRGSARYRGQALPPHGRLEGRLKGAFPPIPAGETRWRLSRLVFAEAGCPKTTRSAYWLYWQCRPISIVHNVRVLLTFRGAFCGRAAQTEKRPGAKTVLGAFDCFRSLGRGVYRFVCARSRCKRSCFLLALHLIRVRKRALVERVVWVQESDDLYTDAYSEQNGMCSSHFAVCNFA